MAEDITITFNPEVYGEISKSIATNIKLELATIISKRVKGLKAKQVWMEPLDVDGLKLGVTCHYDKEENEIEITNIKRLTKSRKGKPVWDG